MYNKDEKLNTLEELTKTIEMLTKNVNGINRDLSILFVATGLGMILIALMVIVLTLN